MPNKQKKYSDYLLRAMMYSVKPLECLKEAVKLASEYEKVSVLVDNGRKKEFDDAVKYIAETTGRGIIEAAGYCCSYWDKYGEYPKEKEMSKKVMTGFGLEDLNGLWRSATPSKYREDPERFGLVEGECNQECENGGLCVVDQVIPLCPHCDFEGISMFWAYSRDCAEIIKNVFTLNGRKALLFEDFDEDRFTQYVVVVDIPFEEFMVDIMGVDDEEYEDDVE